MNLAVETAVAINRLFPKPNVQGRESDEAYSDWEYEVGRSVFVQHFGAEVLRGARVLDVGCGMGGKTVWYAEAGAETVVGLDIEAKHVRQARRYAADRDVSGRLNIVQGDAMKLPFGDGSFSVVTANDSMEHFADPAAALKELGRVLVPGGRLLLYFTPYYSPLGSHLYDHVKIPWCQVVMPRKILYAVLQRSVQEEEKAQGGGFEERAERRYREIVRYFENDVNGITVDRFHQILQHEPSMRARKVSYVVPKFSFLSPLTRVPKLRELFAGLVFADLERTA